MSKLSDITGIGSDEPEQKLSFIPIEEEKKTPVKPPILKRVDTKPTSINKIVLCRNRALTLQELVLLNRMYSVLEFKSDFHGSRKASELLFELLILNFNNKTDLKWYMRDIKYLKSNCHIINLSLSKRHLGDSKISKMKEKYCFDSIIKSISNEFTSGAELLSDMLVSHVSLPQNSCIDACLRLAQKKK